VPVGGRQLRVLFTLLALNAGRVVPAASMAAQGSPSAFRVPSPLTSFVGRDEDVSRVLKNLGTARLVTLTGPGGVGKTRLAAEVSGRLDVRVWFVPLAPVTDPAEVAYAVLDSFGIREAVIARRAPEPGSGPLGQANSSRRHMSPIHVVLSREDDGAAGTGAAGVPGRSRGAALRL
jgi:hypothetical protein